MTINVEQSKMINIVPIKIIFWLIGWSGVSQNVQNNLTSEEKHWLFDVVIPSMQPISQRQPGMLNDRINFSFLNYSLNKITVPTLVINANDDTLVNPSHSEYAAQNTFAPKNDLLVLTYYSSFTNFKMKIGQYFRSKCFNMNIRNYLIGMMCFCMIIIYKKIINRQSFFVHSHCGQVGL